MMALKISDVEASIGKDSLLTGLGIHSEKNKRPGAFAAVSLIDPFVVTPHCQWWDEIGFRKNLVYECNFGQIEIALSRIHHFCDIRVPFFANRCRCKSLNTPFVVTVRGLRYEEPECWDYSGVGHEDSMCVWNLRKLIYKTESQAKNDAQNIACKTKCFQLTHSNKKAEYTR